jgi:hypothetical protein
MRAWPITCSSVLGVCAPLFARPVWPHVQVLLTGAVLAPGKRTVPAILQVRGRRAASDLQTSHRVLHRAVWSPRTARRRRRLWVAGCIPRGGVVWGLDDTIERRRDEAMAAQGSSPAPGICMKLSIDNCCKFNGFMLLSQALSQGLRGCSSFSRCLNRQTLSGSTGALQKAVQVKLGLKDRLHPTIC